jgi:hypothetical protein
LHLFSGNQKNCIEIVLLCSEKLELFVIAHQSGNYFDKSTAICKKWKPEILKLV